VGVKHEAAPLGGAVAVVELARGRRPQVALHPIELASASDGRYLSGLPRLIPSDSEQWGAGMAVLGQRSRPFGASVDTAGVVAAETA
jgi:hypothetical protein